MITNYPFTKYLSEEAQEWLCITTSDLILWLTMIFIVVIIFIDNLLLGIILCIFNVILSIFACFLGIKHNPNISQVTMIMKLICQPLGSVLVIGVSTFSVFAKYFLN